MYDAAVLDEQLDSEVPVAADRRIELAGMPIDAEASQLLKIMFLNKPNRYLVFSTHAPMTPSPAL